MRETSYKKYLLTVLLFILCFNYVDRLALGIVLQDVKVDLELSDTQLGLLSGIAFALFYSVMGIPISRWADRGNRVTIITVTTVLWSVAVALCGMAANFIQLLLIRIGVAVGEAGCIPPAHSLIADYFTRDERPHAMGIYMMGGSLSGVIGYFLAGWLNELYGWRVTFMVLGIPGLVLAGLAITLREPRRGDSLIRVTGGAENFSRPLNLPAAPKPSLKAVCTALAANTTFRHLLASTSVVYFFGYGILQWQPAFFIRSHQLHSGELGTWFAVIWGGGGVLGTYLGGAMASRHAASNERLQLKLAAAIYAGSGLISMLIYLSPNHYLAFAVMGVAALAIPTVNGPLFATMQTLVPDRMRAMSVAIVYLFANLIGMGLGPLMAGVLSDHLRPYFGEESLRYALLALSPGYVWGAWHLWSASKTVSRDLDARRTFQGDACGAV